jgi:maltose O-acetyltransferase
MSGNHATASVTIGKNVFIGSRVTVLKGVTIGDNSVIAAGSIVVKDIPEGEIHVGILDKIISTLAG